MGRSETFKLIGVLALSTLLGATRSHPRVLDSRERNFVAAEVLLTRLSTMTCTTHCEYCEGGDPLMHFNQVHSNPDDGGEIHTCAVSPNGCADHSCEISDDYVELAAALSGLDARSIQQLARSHPRLYINAERRALQLIGCSDKVVMSVTATQSQAAGLFDR